MKKNIFVIAAVAMLLGMTACQKEDTTFNPAQGNSQTTALVKTTSDLIGTDWTANLTLADLVYAMTGMNLSDYGCETDSIDGDMVFHLSFDADYAHFTFGDNIGIVNVSQDDYTMEEISQMSFAYVYNGATHTGTLTAVGVDEENQEINYQINFTYSDNDDTITIDLLFANAEDEDTTISFPLVFHRDA